MSKKRQQSRIMLRTVAYSLFIITAVAAGSAIAASCPEYDYRELKDMREKQLIDSYCDVMHASRLADDNLKFQQEMLEFARRNASRPGYSGSLDRYMESYNRASNDVTECIDKVANVRRQVRNRNIPEQKLQRCLAPSS